ncbi:unnamed protein product [Phytophthora fragariaefolia]|uniref:Unnamed protein product n=1 Tax=Phytophthora fragariaefolia TaxID=1490495 RepID=A0A9W7CRC5_9STRA|nr:unnamed protein product [Phytophthora fragariaefolia]
MHALRVWRVYRLGRPFTVETDHKSIEMILTQKTTNCRVARWFNELAGCQPLFQWIPGETNTVDDALSRNQVFERKTAHNRDLHWIIKKLEQGKDVPQYSLLDGILCYLTDEDETPRLYIPDDDDLENRVICENHDAVSAGHPGFYKIYLAVREKYYWPKMMTYIQRYVNTCEMCQRNKARQTKPPGLHQPLDIPKDATTDIADVFMKNYVNDHGLPKTIVSDRDTKFTSKLWRSIVKALGTQHNLSSAFRPQTDGRTERTNRFVRDYLRGVINPARNDWDEYLHLAEFAYNRPVHSTIGTSPFEADLGYVPYMSGDVASDPEFTKLEKSARELLLRQETLLKVAQNRKSEAQWHHHSTHRGQVIWNGVVHWTISSVKEDFEGFLRVRNIERVEVASSVSYITAETISQGPKAKAKVNKVVLGNGTEGQLVEAVIGHRKYKGKPQYKIWWLGESKAEATWEPVENLNQAPRLIDLYWKSKKQPKLFSK